MYSIITILRCISCSVGVYVGHCGKRRSENKCGILLPLLLIWLIKVAIFSFTRFSSFKTPSSLQYGPRFSCLYAKNTCLTHLLTIIDIFSNLVFYVTPQLIKPKFRYG